MVRVYFDCIFSCVDLCLERAFTVSIVLFSPTPISFADMFESSFIGRFAAVVSGVTSTAAPATSLKSEYARIIISSTVLEARRNYRDALVGNSDCNEPPEKSDGAAARAAEEDADDADEEAGPSLLAAAAIPAAAAAAKVPRPVSAFHDSNRTLSPNVLSFTKPLHGNQSVEQSICWLRRLVAENSNMKRFLIIGDALTVQHANSAIAACPDLHVRVIDRLAARFALFCYEFLSAIFLLSMCLCQTGQV